MGKEKQKKDTQNIKKCNTPIWLNNLCNFKKKNIANLQHSLFGMPQSNNAQFCDVSISITSFCCVK